MIDHECMVCGCVMNDKWSICVDCLADSFGWPYGDPIRDHHNIEMAKKFRLDAEQEALLRHIMQAFRDGTKRYAPEDTEDDGEG